VSSLIGPTYHNARTRQPALADPSSHMHRVDTDHAQRGLTAAAVYGAKLRNAD
jgi:hypothetical protein